MATIDSTLDVFKDVWGDVLSQSHAKGIRSMRQFTSEEVVVPKGKYEGLKYDLERQPYCRHWFDAVENPYWNTFVGMGPSQSGKSLLCFVIPIMYHLFELNETVIAAVPTMAMGYDKWVRDIKPTIEKSRYGELLPTRGKGAKGGTPEAVEFAHGPTLRFMSAGGSDKQRAGYTSRVICITEANGFKAQATSAEADPIRQILARARHYAGDKRVYIECTVENQACRIWQEFVNGSAGQLALKCPSCGDLIVSFDAKYINSRTDLDNPIDKWRENLIGWQEAETEVQAEEQARFRCPECREPWTDAQRVEAIQEAAIAHKSQLPEHKDQKIDLTKPLPETRTFSMRWGGMDNMFTDASFIGSEEWKASRSEEGENPELELSQFVWGIPYDVRLEATRILTADAVVKSAFKDTYKGYVPDDVITINAGADVGKRAIYWVVIATVPVPGDTPDMAKRRYLICEYGVQNVASDYMDQSTAVKSALRDLRDDLYQQYNLQWLFVDARYFKAEIFEVMRDGPSRMCRASYGKGTDQMVKTRYDRPRETGGKIIFIGHGYHMVFLPEDRIFLMEIDSPMWKGIVHDRFMLARDADQALGLYVPPLEEGNRHHITFGKHITAERGREEYIPGKGKRRIWEVIRRTNHFLDSTYLASTATQHWHAMEGIKIEPGGIKMFAPPGVNAGYLDEY